jgi:2-dehydro-3-deoxygluconokinase
MRHDWIGAMSALDIRSPESCQWDVFALGEVMLRFDPGAGRVRTARSFDVSEGGGEYNVARAGSATFGLRSGVVTALVDNELGHLIKSLIWAGGVDTSHVIWRPFDGIGAECRLGLNFIERGFGIRPAIGVSDRANTAVSQLRPGDIDWKRIFDVEGVRWFHTGGIFAALSRSTAEVALEAVDAARTAGTMVSYDLNYRPSLWDARGGSAAAIAINREIARSVDVLIGNEEDFTAALGFDVAGVDHEYVALEGSHFKAMIGAVVDRYPNLRAVATTLRTARSASINDWGAVLWADGDFHEAKSRPNLEIFDRVGGGDGFASGLAYAKLTGRSWSDAVELGAAHGALAMTTPGDTSMVSAADVERAVRSSTARVIR